MESDSQDGVQWLLRLADADFPLLRPKNLESGVQLWLVMLWRRVEFSGSFGIGPNRQP
jgi:hypothetical protein